jgi:hypothetical protein
MMNPPPDEVRWKEGQCGFYLQSRKGHIWGGTGWHLVGNPTEGWRLSNLSEMKFDFSGSSSPSRLEVTTFPPLTSAEDAKDMAATTYWLSH